MTDRVSLLHHWIIFVFDDLRTALSEVCSLVIVQFGNSSYSLPSLWWTKKFNAHLVYLLCCLTTDKVAQSITNTAVVKLTMSSQVTSSSQRSLHAAVLHPGSPRPSWGWPCPPRPSLSFLGCIIFSRVWDRFFGIGSPFQIRDVGLVCNHCTCFLRGSS